MCSTKLLRQSEEARADPGLSSPHTPWAWRRGNLLPRHPQGRVVFPRPRVQPNKHHSCTFNTILYSTAQGHPPSHQHSAGFHFSFQAFCRQGSSQSLGRIHHSCLPRPEPFLPVAVLPSPAVQSCLCRHCWFLHLWSLLPAQRSADPRFSGWAAAATQSGTDLQHPPSLKASETTRSLSTWVWQVHTQLPPLLPTNLRRSRRGRLLPK